MGFFLYFLRSPTANTHFQKPFSLNTIALIQFVTYAIIIVPPNFSWQRYIETRFPGAPSTRGWRRAQASATSSVIHSSSVVITMPSSPPVELLSRKEKSVQDAALAAGSNSGMRNFIIKFMLDQTIAGFANIVLFVVLINLLKGASPAKIWDAIGEVCTHAHSYYLPNLEFWSWIENMWICLDSYQTLRLRYGY